MSKKRFPEKKRTKRKRIETGQVPGSLIFTGEQKMETPNVSVWQFNLEKLVEKKLVNREIPPVEPYLVNWYDIRGLHDVSLVEKIGHTFNIHPLVLEDILNPHQRPKFDGYESGFFIVSRAISLDSESIKIKTEQIAFYVGQDFVISFQEDENDTFSGVKERVRSARGKIRFKKADFLTYALLDNIVDHYYHVLDGIEEVIDDLEDEILSDVDGDTKSKIHHLKREMLTLRRSVTPLREAINRFAKTDSDFVQETTQLFLRDLYDHTVQVMDAIETYRDTLTGLQDLYLSEISFKMNNVMQVLTIIATIFIPLTFLAGIYGMNFKYMPELEWENGYFVFWGLMIVIALSLLYFFKKKNWL